MLKFHQHLVLFVKKFTRFSENHPRKRALLAEADRTTKTPYGRPPLTATKTSHQPKPNTETKNQCLSRGKELVPGPVLVDLHVVLEALWQRLPPETPAAQAPQVRGRARRGTPKDIEFPYLRENVVSSVSSMPNKTVSPECPKLPK